MQLSKNGMSFIVTSIHEPVKDAIISPLIRVSLSLRAFNSSPPCQSPIISLVFLIILLHIQVSMRGYAPPICELPLYFPPPYQPPLIFTRPHKRHRALGPAASPSFPEAYSETTKERRFFAYAGKRSSAVLIGSKNQYLPCF
jgi:hypothetical protein